MAGQRARITRQAMINGQPLMKEIEEWTPPNPKKEMKDTRGGAFIPGQIMVGMEKMGCKFKVLGATQAVLAAYGLKDGEKCQVDVKDSLEDEGGEKFKVHYSVTGEVIAVTEGGTKMGELPEHEFEMAVDAYKKTEDGKTLYDIDRNVPSCDLGEGDLLAEHRRNVGLA